MELKNQNPVLFPGLRYEIYFYIITAYEDM